MKSITIFVTVLIVFCVTPVYPLVYMNYFCNNLSPQCQPANNTQPPNTPQEVFDGYQNLAYLQAKAANNFLTASGNWSLFLAKFEMAEVSQVDYLELSSILKGTIQKIGEAENILIRINEASRQYQVNPTAQENLKNFDYKWFCTKNNLNPAIMSEVECYLNTGDILAIPDKIRENLADIKNQIEWFRQSVERQEPNIDEMYTINQNLLTMAIFGQYTSMIFREVMEQ
jgi:hypothetical protein